MGYYCVKQQDTTDCGAACLATIAKQNGYKTSIAKIREIAGTDRNGTTAYGIIKAAGRLGFNAKGVKGKEEAILSDIPLPCIAHVTVDGQLLHYVVIHKITKQKIIIADPAEGIVELTLDDFFGRTNKEDEVPKYKWNGLLILIEKNSTFKKSDDTKGLFNRFFCLLKPQRKLVFHIFIASILYTFLGITGAFYFKVLIDNILPNKLNNGLIIISIAVIILNIFRVILQACRSYLLLFLSQKLDIAILLQYYRHVLTLPMNFFSSRKVGEIISRFNDAGKVREAISGATITIMIDTLMVIAGGYILFVENSRMFLMTIVIVLLYAIIVVAFNKKYEKLNKQQMENGAQLTSYMVESLNGIQTIKAYNSEAEVNSEAEKKFIKVLKDIFDLGWVSNIQNSLKLFIELVGGIILLWIGGESVINGKMSMGELITFNSLVIYFMEPVKNLINLQPQIQTAVVAADRLVSILDLQPEKSDDEYQKIEMKSLDGDIDIKDLDFRYGEKKLTLEKINLHIKRGEKIALVGESGSGKTTLAKLFLHLYSPESGRILINGVNIEDIQIEKLREKIAYIPQETFLFSGTILDNLTLGMEEENMDAVIEAAKIAQADSFINDLPLRYKTKLDENGSNLSGGQRQRLAIARAILKKPDILILDEATSNLDAITESALDHTINEFCKNMTTIVIAHRLSTIKNSDMICVMDKGRIIESGTHDQLFSLGGKYTELVRQQSL